MTDVGSVVSLWRYPVKSMMGEELNATDVTDHGLLGDRVYALLDPATGKVASAKNPRKWVRLFNCRASFVEPPRVAAPPRRSGSTLPGGRLLPRCPLAPTDPLPATLAQRSRL